MVRLRGLAFYVTLMVPLVLAGCSRPELIPGEERISQTETREAPFQDQATQGTVDVAASTQLQPAQYGSTLPQSDAPLQRFQNLPPGTLVTVRLKKPLYASSLSSEASFEALVVEPVVIRGNTLIPPGASVLGRVESARTSTVKPNRGYVRLALHSVQVGNVRMPLETASLFAREAPLGDDPISVIHLESGRRLTFRLNATASTANQHSEVSQ
jgi:hypothetical protein